MTMKLPTIDLLPILSMTTYDYEVTHDLQIGTNHEFWCKLLVSREQWNAVVLA